jgi:zinc transport system substrate-binding protein
MILPLGVDAHSFEPTPKLMAKIMRSQLVIYSGAGLEPWTSSFEFKSKVIDMSKSVKLLKPKDKHDGHAHNHGHNAVDPHYWLDIQNMISATELISEEFIKISPENKQVYKSNSEKYIAKLKSIDAKYKKALSNCKKETIIVNHNAFSYLSSNYGFHVEALNGLSPDAQPSAKDMVRVIEHVREHDVKTIFFESFVNDKAMKSIAQEAKVSVEVLQPLGNITRDEAQKNLSYEDIMLDNLKKISKALVCE